MICLPNKRDDFSDTTKALLANRVCGRCSNPNCRKPTLGANTNPEKTINIGVAAHICAAADGGPRYDSAMTPAERKSSQNGIWLCQSCAKLIDSDPIKYSKELLYTWKKLAETTSALELERPFKINAVDEKSNNQTELDSHNNRWFESGEQRSPFTWCHSELDKFCKVTDGSVILVSGCIGVGIDMYVQNVVRHNLKINNKVIYFNLKESSTTIVNSMIAAECLVSFDCIRTATLTAEEWQRMAYAANELEHSELILEPYSSSGTSMNSYVLSAIKNGNADIVVIDDLDGLNIGDTSFFYQLRNAASESGTIVFILVDIAGVPKRVDKRPLLTDDPICKISKFCDVIQFLYHDDNDYLLSGSESRIIEVIVAKNYLPTQNGVFYLAQLPKYSKMVEYEHTEKSNKFFEKYPGAVAGAEALLDCLKNI